MLLNEAIGAKVNELLFLNRVTKKALGEELGITGPGVSRKIYGQTAWSVEDLYAVADFFGVDVVDLLPGLRVKKCVRTRGFSRIDL